MTRLIRRVRIMLRARRVRRYLTSERLATLLNGVSVRWDHRHAA